MINWPKLFCERLNNRFFLPLPGSKLSRVFCLLFALSLGGASHAVEHPSWASFEELLGQEATSAEVVAFAKKNDLSETTKGPSGSFTPRDHAYSLLYRRSKISTIILKVGPFPKDYREPHWKAYGGKLPGGLHPADGRGEVVKKLGKPVDSRKDTWKVGPLHIWVHFNQGEDEINELYVSPHVIEAAAN